MMQRRKEKADKFGYNHKTICVFPFASWRLCVKELQVWNDC